VGRLLTLTLLCCACAGVEILPGHRGVLVDPARGGVQAGVLQPGFHPLSCARRSCQHVDDFDVTYTRATERIDGLSSEGLPLKLEVTVIYRPVIAELEQLDREQGAHYYETTVRPVARAVIRESFSARSYLDLPAHDARQEAEMEAQLHDRTYGRHVEIASVIIESITYPPAVAAAVRSSQEAAQERAALEAELKEREASLEALRRAHARF
jgi:regulator of protease activity HflC (stomatin/prohibitin superfamily)